MLIKVKVFPASKKEELIKKSEDNFEIWVKEPPVMGRANRAVIEALAKYFGVAPAKIRLIKGFRERNKILEL